MNPMLQMITQSPATATPPQTQTVDNDSQITQLIQMFKQAQNPAALMEQMCMQNPAMKESYEMAKGLAGRDPKAIFYATARAQGVDPESILQRLRD